MFQSQGLSRITKKDFLRLFWPAFVTSFTESNIKSAWRKTGLFPLDATIVLAALPKRTTANIDKEERPPTNYSSSSSAISSSEVRKIRTLLETLVSYQEDHTQLRKLTNTVYSLSTQNQLLKSEINGLKHTIFEEKKQNKRTKGIFEQLRAQDGQGGLWLSPNKVVQAYEIQRQRDDDKAQEEAAKQLAKEEKHQKKLLEDQQRLEKKRLREETQAKKKAAEAAAKAAKEQAKHMQKASQQLNNEYQASITKTKRQKQLTVAPLPPPVLHNIKVTARPSNPASSRPQRQKRTPRHLEGFQIES